VCSSFTPARARIQHHCSYMISTNISKGTSAMANQTADTFKHQQLEPGAHPSPLAALRRNPFLHMHMECESVQKRLQHVRCLPWHSSFRMPSLVQHKSSSARTLAAKFSLLHAVSLTSLPIVGFPSS
jgi:hypothetical protein